MATVKWETANSRTTGISAGTLNSGANLLGSEIDNSVNKDRFASFELTFTPSVAPFAFANIELYLLLALNGTNYEDGDETPTDPARTMDGQFASRAETSAQKVTIKNVPLAPFKFKPLLKSELGQNATAVTLLCYTHNEEMP